MAEQFNRKLILETGEEYCGYGFGANEERVCEIVFNTSMVGYQEIISDPAYADLAVVMSYPLIGNYGIADDDNESRANTVGALIVREYNNLPSNFRYTKTLDEVLEESRIPGISGIDTRMLVRTLRDKGSRRGLITGMDTSLQEGLHIIADTPRSTDVLSRVSCKKRWYSRTSNHLCNVVAIDCGITLSVIRSLNSRGCNVTVVPHNTDVETIHGMKPDGILISNGPGNPDDAPEVVERIRALRGKYPIFGLGIGQHLIAHAYGARTKKLPFGHHGANHAVRCLQNNRVEIVNQNQCYAIDRDSLKDTGLTVTHTDLMDDTVCGIQCPQDNVIGLQYIPGTTPAPESVVNPYDRFVNLMKEAKQHA
ncbi:MAG: glutamine-hydrolyzing carbamoyl-phosphate synthase small subunit [Christensenellales bacterium]|nr:glutamine-hydrolyzing carbamoyl-phosphate synthase small subunit [Christensenellales bacterium]